MGITGVVMTGIAYAVGTGSSTCGCGAGFILAYAGTTPERCTETVDVLVGELRRIAEGVTDEELARARTGLLSALIMQGESTRARANALGRDQYLLGRVRSLNEIRRAVVYLRWRKGDADAYAPSLLIGRTARRKAHANGTPPAVQPPPVAPVAG